MQKIKITNQNAKDMYDYSCKTKDFGRLNPCRFYSIPDPDDVHLESDGIYVDYPVSTIIPIGSYLYFIGGNIIGVRPYYQFNHSYSSFLDVYHRNPFGKKYDTLGD